MTTTSDSEETFNILLSIAYLGSLTKFHIQRLWYPNNHISKVDELLADLHKDDLLELRRQALRDKEEKVTRQMPARWVLSKAGLAMLKKSDLFPDKPAPVRAKKLSTHDARTIDTIVRLIELARPAGLSGLFVQYEERLDPKQSAPICDAVVILQLGQYDHPNLIPWTRDPAVWDETRLRFTIESDNATESRSVYRGKAVVYNRTHNDVRWRDTWIQRFGPTPLPIWVVPNQERLDMIHQAWREKWPHGRWWMTTDKKLIKNQWKLYAAGVEHDDVAMDFVAVRAAHLRISPQAVLAGAAAPQQSRLQRVMTRASEESKQTTIVAQLPQLPAPRDDDEEHDPVVAFLEQAREANEQTRVVPVALVPPAPPTQSVAVPVAHEIEHVIIVPQPVIEAPTIIDVVPLPKREHRVLRAVLMVLWWMLKIPFLFLYHGARTTIEFWHDLSEDTKGLFQVLGIGAVAIIVMWHIVVPFIFAPANSTATVAATPAASCGTATVNASGVKLRVAAGTDQHVIRALIRGEQLRVLCDAEASASGFQWRHVASTENEGWAATTWLHIAP